LKILWEMFLKIPGEPGEPVESLEVLGDPLGIAQRVM
jgi:hypothetical protein